MTPCCTTLNRYIDRELTQGCDMPAQAPETRIVTHWKIACDGGEGALGHPRVWLTIPDSTGVITCGYCDQRFEIDRAHAQDDH